MQKYVWTLIILSSSLAFGLNTCDPTLEADWSPKISPVWLQNLKDPEVVHLSQQTNIVQQGKTLFTNNCAACHGETGQGNVCSSLIDSEWQFSDGSPVALIKTIWWGVPNQGMPSWAKILSPDEFKALGAYLYTLQAGAQRHE